MELTALRRLPGIAFRHEVPTPPDALPRMDVAGFVGLASCGPIGVPVPVEDAGRFRDLFGPDLPLAWDAEAGRTATAFLGPAVDAFFRNGGRRCWVVRVARGTTTSRFPLPTLLDAATGRPALVHARCAGSWADALRVGAVLQARTVTADSLRVLGGGFELTVPMAETLRPGDVLRVTFHEEAQQTQLVLPIQTVEAIAGERCVTTGAGRVFLRRPPQPLARVRVRADVLAPDGTGAASADPAVLEHEDGQYRLRYDTRRGPDLVAGQVVHLTVTRGPLTGRTLWLAVGDVERTPREAQPGREWIIAHAADALWPLDPAGVDAEALLAGLAGARTVVERLAFELVVWEGGQVQARLGDLGLAPSEAPAGSPERLAARFWADLPTDEALFQLQDGRSVAPTAALARSAFTPRFPLAGPPDPAALYVPLAMPAAPDHDVAQPALEADPETRLERDGLDGFAPTWLLDDELAHAGLGGLPAYVFDRLYVRRRPLDAAHALWPLDEVTLLAAPDAVQPGWRRRTPPLPPPLDPPRRPDATPLDAPGGFRLDWLPAGVDEAVFELEEATDPLFAGATVRYRGDDTHSYVYFGTEGLCGEDLGCVAPRHYRLRVRVGGRLSPWSETLRLDPAPTGFRACHQPPEAPRLRLRADPVRLRWDAIAGATRYVLEAAAEVTFFEPDALTLSRSDPETPLSCSDDCTYRLDPLPTRATYYRVRAEIDRVADDGSVDTETSPWSGAVRYEPPSPIRWVMRTPEDFNLDGAEADLRAFHHAVLRLGAARGDLVALLTLPAHYRAEAADAYTAALAPEPTGVARSFGALYHPWIGVRDESGRAQRVRYLPPDGAVTGLVAARARERGAWVAPANVALRDVVALEPGFDETTWARLLTRGLNLVRPTPRGFALLSAETLAAGELRPLNVRRLLILLRRLALREGHAFAFASNSAALRRRVALRFEDYLTRLFQRGAFAGSRPDDAFQVRADAAVNPPESVDRGRLIVELRVAPSQPLAFLTVRLVQLDGAGLTVVEA